MASLGIALRLAPAAVEARDVTRPVPHLPGLGLLLPVLRKQLRHGLALDRLARQVQHDSVELHGRRLARPQLGAPAMVVEGESTAAAVQFDLAVDPIRDALRDGVVRIAARTRAVLRESRDDRPERSALGI